MDVREKLVEQAISHFWYGVSHDIFSEPVTTYAKLAIEALKKENGVTVQEHGNWKYYHKQNKAVCTSCSFERDLDANFGKAIACPNCGAYMSQPPKGE